MCRYVVLLTISVIPALPAMSGSPTVTGLYPIAVERGKTLDATFYGARLHDATGILIHTPGITAGEITDVQNNRVKTKLTIAPDAPLGEHQLRVVTKTGVSEMITMQVVGRTLVQEKRDEKIENSNNRFRQSTSFDQPQVVELGTTIVGRTEAEDTDYFAVDLKKDQRLSVQVDGMRLGRGFTDSYLAVLDDQRFEVAASDDTPLLMQDPYISFKAPKDGRYVILLRDSGYGGDNNNWYLMHVGKFPRPAVVFPLGGLPGAQAKLRFIGDVEGEIQQQVTLPDQPDNNYRVTPERDGIAAPTGHVFRVNRLPNYIEADSNTNNSMGQVEKVEPINTPAAINGIIDKPGDNDFYKFTLKKGQSVTIKCYAGSMGSPLDSVINVWQADNKQHLIGNDDQGGVVTNDSAVEFSAPVDGDYYLRVRDHRGRGGPEFVYRVEITVPSPSLSTYIHRYDQNRPQSRQAIAVPKGNRTAALVRVRRQQVGGDLTPIIEGLPAGVSYIGLGTAQVGDQMPVVFEAAPEADLAAALVDIGAQSQAKEGSSERITGHFYQPTAIVLANPNRTEYYHSTLNTMPVAVTEAAPAKIDVVPPKAPLVRDGVMKLKVNLTRDNFDGRVRTYLLWRPPGLGGAGTVEFNNGKTEADYPIDANNGTPTRDWPMAIYGYIELPTGPVWISSQIFNVKVEEPFVTGKLDKAKCTQGEPVEIVLQLEHPRQWEGEGEVRLLGLPAECKVEPVKVKHGQDKAVFRVQTAGNTPPGQHKTLMCELTIQINGEPVVHRMGRGGQLRIDRPRNNSNAQARGDNRK